MGLTSRRVLLFLPLVMLVAFVGAVGWRLTKPDDAVISSKLVGKSLPAFALPPIIAGRAGLASGDLTDGKPRLLNIFASWCVPCIAEAPVLMELKRVGVSIEAIAVRDRSEAVAQFLTRHGDPFDRIGSDVDSRVQLALGSSGVPESFVIDGRGVIRFQHIGPIEPGDVPAILAELESAR